MNTAPLRYTVTPEAASMDDCEGVEHAEFLRKTHGVIKHTGIDTDASKSEVVGVIGYEIITKYTGHKTACRDLVKKLTDTGGDIHCMGSAEFVDPNYPNETCRFEEGWAWLQQQPGSKLVIVVEMTSCVGRVV